MPASVGLAGRTCGACIAHPPAFDAARCALRYTGAAAYLVHRLKFSGDLAAGRVLAHLMLERAHLAPLREPAALVPVPLHPSRLRERGFNQAAELATHLARSLGWPVRHAVVRTRAGVAQSTLTDAGARRRNVRRAFKAVRHVAGWNVVLVDDVLTTGATLGAIATALKKAGADRVEVWCCARTSHR